MTEITSFLSGWLHFGVVMTLMVVAVARKRDASSALGWCLFIAFAPIVGPLSFLIFGLNRIPRRLSRNIAHRQRSVLKRACPKPKESVQTPLSPGAIASSLGGGPCRQGNSVAVLNRGMDTYNEIIKSIEGAKHHIHIQFFIFRDDSVGKRLLEVLAKKAREGVEVRLLIDGMGTISGWKIIREVRRSGGQAAAFLPLPFQGRFISPNLRNHRKSIICDGRMGFLGGFNVGEEYLGKDGNRRPWFDLHLKVEGPSVLELQEAFSLDWSFCTHEAISGSTYFPNIDCRNDGVALRIIAGGPDTDPNPIRESIFAAITRAQKRVVIATPYLVPDQGLLDALTMASRSGIAVDIVIQSEPTDHFIVYLCSLFFAEQLTQAGARILEYRPGMMHAKSMIVDENFAVVGTANLDRRSMDLNFELVALIENPSSTQQIRDQLDSLVRDSSILPLQMFSQWPRRRKIAVALARLLAPLL